MMKFTSIITVSHTPKLTYDAGEYSIYKLSLHLYATLGAPTKTGILTYNVYLTMFSMIFTLSGYFCLIRGVVRSLMHDARMSILT